MESFVSLQKKNNMDVIFLKEAQQFMNDLDSAPRQKIYHNIASVRNGVKDTRLFKKLEGSDIWEFRTTYAGNAYRLFSFWDTRNDTLVVATHGLKKKTQRTPAKEIAKAERIRNDYFNTK